MTPWHDASLPISLRRYHARVRARGLIVLSSALILSFLTESASADSHLAGWLYEAKWGVFVHYLAGTVARGDETTVEEWNHLVDDFDVAGLADQIASVGAKYFFITLGQNSGHYIAPNPTYDEIVGISPSKCSRRDLVTDLYEVLAPKGIRLCVYLPSGAPDRDKVAVERLGWKRGDHAYYQAKVGKDIPRNKDLIAFQRKWERVIADWSKRWGKKVCGWWFDGCYYPYEMYIQPDPPNFESLAAAARAGNPDSIVAFNHGVIGQSHPHRNPGQTVVHITPREDYTAGEIMGVMESCHGRFVDGAQFHILSHLGRQWGHDRPRFSERWLIEYVREINHYGGVVTWDVPVRPDGRIPQEYIDQFRALSEGLAKPRPQLPPGNLASFKPARLLNLSGTKPLWVNGSKHFARHGVDSFHQTHALAGGEWPWTYHVDLLETASVARVVVWFPKSNYATEYKVVVSADGKDWKTVAHEKEASPGRHELTFDATPARYVRVVSIKPNGENQPGGQMAVGELEVYAAK